MLVEKSDEQWTHPSSQAARAGKDTHHGALHNQRQGREKKVIIINLNSGEQEVTTTYRMAENFRGRKLSWIGRKGAFR